jgi:hypothetical protein
MDKPIVLYCDNSRTVSQSKELRNYKKRKYIERKYHLIQEFIQRRKIMMEQIASENNLVDPFIKPLAERVFKGHLNTIGVSTSGLT